MNTAASLAERIGAAERGARILCDYLTIHGFLTKEGGRYGLTPESAMFLNRHSPACLATMSDFLTNPRNNRQPSAPATLFWIFRQRTFTSLTVVHRLMPEQAGLQHAVIRVRGGVVSGPLTELPCDL